MRAQLAICFLTTISVVLVPDVVRGQGTMVLSNLGEPSIGTVAVGSNAWIAQIFYTGNSSGVGRDNGFKLDSVELALGGTMGTPTGFTVSIYDAANREGGTGNFLGTLSGSAPESEGVFRYAASDITLASVTFYYVVLTTETSLDAGTYLWSLSGTENYERSPGWQMGLSYWSSSDGNTWSRIQGTPLQFAIHAIPIPEPAAAGLMVSAFLLLGAAGCWGKRQTRRPARAQVPCQ